LREQSARPGLNEKNERDEDENLRQHGPGPRLQQLVDDPHRHAADERAPEIADAAKNNHHERIDDVGLPQIRTDVGQLAQRDARHAGDARAQPERHRIHPLGADTHRLGHRPILRNGPDVETDARALQHQQDQGEDHHVKITM
jgi:hypothetical protein